jgi:tetraacyldisaccharide 4'-kinase
VSRRAGRTGLLWPLVPVYAGVVAAKNWMMDRGWLRVRRLGHPVISVGSVSAGGAGKTPVVMLLAELLGRRGFEVRTLTRGYGRKGSAVLRVDPGGNADESGDEPMLMARRLSGATVWVGVDRYRAGRTSERGDVPGGKVVYLLDDGFQHRKLARDVDIVLVTRREMEDRLLPVGGLREPLTAIRRADVVMVREDEAEVAGLVEGLRTWTIRRRLEFAAGVVVPKRPVAFCGLARPEGFAAMLAGAGIEAADFVEFRDHHSYRESDVERLVEVARAKGADGFLTTEKDAVKLTAGMMERLGRVGAVVAPMLRVELVDDEARMEELLEMLAANSGQHSGGAV